MTRPLTKQTRAIIRALNSGKPSSQIAKDLGIPAYTVHNAKHRHSSLLMSVKKKPAAKWATAAVVTSDTSIMNTKALGDLAFQQTQYGLGRPLPKQLSLWARIKAVFTGDYS